MQDKAAVSRHSITRWVRVVGAEVAPGSPRALCGNRHRVCPQLPVLWEKDSWHVDLKYQCVALPPALQFNEFHESRTKRNDGVGSKTTVLYRDIDAFQTFIPGFRFEYHTPSFLSFFCMCCCCSCWWIGCVCPFLHRAAETRLQAVTGKGCRFPGPNPNSSYALRFVPSPDTGERETCLTITGTHLRKTWMAYCRVVHGATVPMWDSDFVSAQVSMDSVCYGPTRNSVLKG